MSIRSLCAAWDTFWYAPQSPLPVAAFRLAVGLIVINLCWLLYPNMAVLYGSKGIVSAETMAGWWGATPEFSLSALSFESACNPDYFLIALAACGTCLALGLFSRASALLAFLILLSLDSRDHFVFHPAFSLLRMMLLYLSLSPCGETLSIDRLIRLRLNPALGAPRAVSGWAQRLMQFQIVIVYWSALSFQLSGAAWLNGKAVYLATHLEEFRRFSVPLLFDQLWTCNLIGWTVMLIEFALCTLVWVKELRYATLLAGVCMHLAIEYTMVFIPLMQHLMIASYLLFVDPVLLSKLIDRLRSGILAPLRTFSRGKAGLRHSSAEGEACG